MIGAVFDLSFTTYVEEEPTWKNTTHIKILYSKPPCGMTQADIDTLAASIPSINLSAIKEIDKKTMDITEVMASATSAFKIGELPPTHCGDIDYKLIPIGEQPFLTLDKELK